jgi:uncharacterized Zn finger protein
MISQRGTEGLEALRNSKPHKANRIIHAFARKTKAMTDEVRRYAEALKAPRSATNYSEALEAYKRGMGIPRSEVDAFVLARPQLLALERYERRALSRRNRAISILAHRRETKHQHIRWT